MHAPTLVVDRISRRYSARFALDGVSLALVPGELVAVIGRSGAGKTTLLRCLAGALAPTGGAIRIDGLDVARLGARALRAYRARVGMVYQQFNLVRRLRVIDNVLVGRLPHLAGWRRWAALARCFGPGDREIALRCLDHVGLLERTWQRADTLSGGEQQRVAIAKVLAQEPGLVLADEPVASLDLVNGQLVMATLRRIAGEAGLAVLATLHHVDHARRFADRIVGLRDGRLVLDTRPEGLTRAALEAVFGVAPPDGEPVAEPLPAGAGP